MKRRAQMTPVICASCGRCSVAYHALNSASAPGATFIAQTSSPDASSEEKNTQVNALCVRLRKIKTDLLSPDDPKTSDVTYHEWIDEQSVHVMPPRKLNKNVHYYIKCSPKDYLRPMTYMMREIETRGQKVSNVFPLRCTMIPMNFRVDTTTLIGLCMAEGVFGQGKHITSAMAIWS